MTDSWWERQYKRAAGREPMFGYSYSTHTIDTRGMDAMKREVRLRKYVQGLKPGDTVHLLQNSQAYKVLLTWQGPDKCYLWLMGDVPCTVDGSDVLLPEEVTHDSSDWPEVRLTPSGEVSIETAEDDPILLSVADAEDVRRRLGDLLARVKT